MAGFIHDPIQFINLIADNLRDRCESCFVLKELIQNTDDAQATQLHFGRSPGLLEAHHGFRQAILEGFRALIAEAVDGLQETHRRCHRSGDERH